MNCQKELFRLPDNEHYLNCSYLSPLLRSVEEAGLKGLRKKRQPWTIKPDDFFDDSEKVRQRFAKLIHADDPQQIAILPAVSYGMGIVAKNLPAKKGGSIVVVGEQFPSNVYPWMRFCNDHGCTLTIVSAPDQSKKRGEKWNQQIVEAITDDTIMVAIGTVHWADGTRFDVERIGSRAREKDAWFVIDGTQSVGAMPFDVQKVQPDALICAGYKWLMGPYGTALGYFGPRLTDGKPLEEGWIARKNSRNFSGLVEYEEEYQSGAVRFDVGERSNFINMPMMAEALKQVIQWTPKNIQEYCRDLCSEMIGELKENGFRIEDEAWRGHHMFGIRLPKDLSMEMLSKKLAENHLHVSVRGSAVRVAPHVYNDARDVEVLRDVLLTVG